MKYIVLSRSLPSGRKQELPFLFPEDVPYDDMLDVLIKLFRGAGVVAAGEACFASAPRCYGGSTALDKRSREQYDGLLVQLHDFRHGLSDEPNQPPHLG